MKTLEKTAEELYLESLEKDVEFTEEETEVIKKASSLFGELREELSPRLFKKLLTYSNMIGEARYFQGLRSFEDGLKAGRTTNK